MKTRNYRVGETVKVIGWTTSGWTTARILAITGDGYYVRGDDGMTGGGWSDSDFAPLD